MADHPFPIDLYLVFGSELSIFYLLTYSHLAKYAFEGNYIINNTRINPNVNAPIKNLNNLLFIILMFNYIDSVELIVLLGIVGFYFQNLVFINSCVIMSIRPFEIIEPKKNKLN